MDAYIRDLCEGDYENYLESLSNIVDKEIDNKGIHLREAAKLVVADIFCQLREDRASLDKLITKMNEVFDPPCQDDMELESRTVYTVICKIGCDELCLAEWTGLAPRKNRF